MNTHVNINAYSWSSAGTVGLHGCLSQLASAISKSQAVSVRHTTTNNDAEIVVSSCMEYLGRGRYPLSSQTQWLNASLNIPERSV
jgi:hypothetical protein